jgi:hypothetical protein
MSSGEDDSSWNTTTTKGSSLPFRICQFWYTLAESFEEKQETTTDDGNITSSSAVSNHHLSFRMTFASAFFLGLMRYGFEKIGLEYYFHWPINSLVTKNAAASCAAMIHSLHLVPGLIACLYTNPQPYNPSASFLHEHKKQHGWNTTVHALLQFCTGYMLYDGILNILWLKTRMVGFISTEDYMFLGHHLATIIYMTSTRIVGAGHVSAMMCMLLGEFTNPFQNSLLFTELATSIPGWCQEEDDDDANGGSICLQIHSVLEMAFSVTYLLLRVIIGPIACMHMTYNLWTQGRTQPPLCHKKWLLVIWTLLIWAVLIGSIPWIVTCWNTLRPIFIPEENQKTEL